MDHSSQSSFSKTIFLFVLAIVFAAGVWGAYAYYFHGMLVSRNAVESLTLENEKIQSQQAQADDMKRMLAEDTAAAPVLASYFVDATNPVPLFETVEGYGTSTNVKVAISTVDVKRQPDRLVVSLAADGSFADLYRFATLLEAAPYEFTFSSFTMNAVAGPATKSGAPVSTGKWHADITISVSSVTNAASVPPKK